MAFFGQAARRVFSASSSITIICSSSEKKARRTVFTLSGEKTYKSVMAEVKLHGIVSASKLTEFMHENFKEKKDLTGTVLMMCVQNKDVATFIAMLKIVDEKFGENEACKHIFDWAFSWVEDFEFGKELFLQMEKQFEGHFPISRMSLDFLRPLVEKEDELEWINNKYKRFFKNPTSLIMQYKKFMELEDKSGSQRQKVQKFVREYVRGDEWLTLEDNLLGNQKQMFNCCSGVFVGNPCKK